AAYRYGMRRSLSFEKVRVTSTASSSKAHGTRYESEPWKRLWLESMPNAVQRLNTPASGVPSNPPMSWLQCANPLHASDRPPRRVSAMDVYVEVLSPPQCTGIDCPPAVAERANSTASPSPRAATSTSCTALLYSWVYRLCMRSGSEPSCHTTSVGMRSPKSVLKQSTPWSMRTRSFD